MTYLRTNRPEEVARILALRDDSETWLAHRGAEQFQHQEFSERARRQISDLAERGRFCVLAGEADELLAAGALIGPDPDFWEEADDLAAAWYVGRLMVAVHGRGYGAQLLDLIGLAAGRDGRRWLRLDCWRTNMELRAYYTREGFELVRVVEHPQRFSGALFQRRVDHEIPAAWDSL